MTSPVNPRPAALVTGAFRGIGFACAQRLAESGFNVLLNDLASPENLAREESLRAELAALGADSAAVFGDVRDLALHAQLVAAAQARWGRIDCLVNNAGVPARQRGDILDVTPESFDRCLAVNARAVFFLTQTVVRAMLAAPAPASGHRSVVTITSSNAEALSIARSEYCASKAAASMITRLFALRLADAGIGVYEIRPGIIATEMTRPAKARYDEAIANHLVPAERWGSPEDVAAAVACVAEGRLPYTVGQVLTVDGGLTIPRF
jgi:NAD(P)-dependent dehydrogenase (short-subunit alcohol dehydrogenase family)